MAAQWIGKTWYAITVTAIVAGGLTGCADEPTYEHPAFAEVVDLHRNSPVANRLPEIIDRAMDQRGSVVLIGVDGAPQVIAKADFDLDGDVDVVSGQQQDVKQALLDAYQRATPNDPEADVFAAIETARRELAGVATHTKTIYVDSSGLSTTGVDSRAGTGALYADPDETVGQLWRSGNEPGDASGMTVSFRGIGDVAAPQDELTGPMRKALIQTQQRIWEKAGAVVEIDETPRTDPTPKQWPADTPPATAIPVTDRWAPTSTPTLLPSAEFFAPNSADLVDHDRTEQLLAPYAEAASRAGAAIRLEGRTADDGDYATYQVPLARDRADALRQVLVDDLGFPADRVSITGVGSRFPEYVPDHDPTTGAIRADDAARNRHVLIAVVRGDAR